ncbi:unnamed protein product [Closterium sp. Naga37s-1]|nr:unnamed protein product [Closterium sp. Naga37s-1]
MVAVGGGRDGWGRREMSEGDEEKSEEGQWREEQGEGAILWKTGVAKDVAGACVAGTRRGGSGGGDWPTSTARGGAPLLLHAAAGARVMHTVGGGWSDTPAGGSHPACSSRDAVRLVACSGAGSRTLCVKGRAARGVVAAGGREAWRHGATTSGTTDRGATNEERGDKTVSVNVLIGRGTPEKTRKEKKGVAVMVLGEKDGWGAEGQRNDKLVSMNVLIGRGALGKAQREVGRERGNTSGKEWEGAAWSEGEGSKVVSMSALIGREMGATGRMEASAWKEGTRAEGGDQLDGAGCSEGRGGEGRGGEGKWKSSKETRHGQQEGQAGWRDGVAIATLARSGADPPSAGACSSGLAMLGMGPGGEDERGREQGRGVGRERDRECEAGRGMGDEVVVVRTRGEGEREREGCRERVEESEVAVRECGGLRCAREGESARESAGGARAAEGGAEGEEAVMQWGDAAEQRQARVGTRAAPLTAGGSTAAHALVGASTAAGMAPLPPQGASMSGGGPPGIPPHTHSTATHPALPPRPPPPAAASPLSFLRLPPPPLAAAPPSPLLRLPPLPPAQPQAATGLQAATVPCTGSQPSHPAAPPLLCPLPPRAPTPPLLTLPTPRPDGTPPLPTHTPPPPQPTLREIATSPSLPAQASKASKHAGLEGTASFGQRLVVLALPAAVHVGVDVKGARRGRVEGGRAVGAVVGEGERAGRGERRARGEKAVGGTVGRRGREVRERGGWGEVRVQVQERVGQAEVEVRRGKRRAEKGVERGRWEGEGWAMKRGRVARGKPATVMLAGVAGCGHAGHSMRPAAAPRSHGAAAPWPGLLCAGARQTESEDGSEKGNEESEEGREEEGEEGREGSEEGSEGSEEGSEGSEEGSGEDREEGSGESSVSGEGPRIRKVWRRSEQGGEAEQGGRAEGERQRRVEAVVRRVQGEQAGRKHGRGGREMLSGAGGRREQRRAHGARAGECGAAWLEQGSSSSSDALGDSSGGASASESRSASEEMQSPPHSKCRHDSLAAARAGLAEHSGTRAGRGGGGVEAVAEEKHGRGADGGEEEQWEQGVMAELASIKARLEGALLSNAAAGQARVLLWYLASLDISPPLLRHSGLLSCIARLAFPSYHSHVPTSSPNLMPCHPPVAAAAASAAATTPRHVAGQKAGEAVRQAQQGGEQVDERVRRLLAERAEALCRQWRGEGW